MSSNISKNLKQLMEEADLPLTSGELMGLNRTALRDILQGRTRSPRYETLLKIANYFQVDVKRLTHGENYDIGAGDNEFQMLISQLTKPEIDFLKASARTLVESRKH